jgi:hypothetical protein
MAILASMLVSIWYVLLDICPYWRAGIRRMRRTARQDKHFVEVTTKKASL